MIFLDSTYLIGLILKNDTYTEKSQTLKPILEKEQKLINSTVLTEVLNSLTPINTKYDIDTILELLNEYNVDFLKSKDYKKSIELYKYYNHAINFSDCTILKTMQENKVTTIVSFNSDFDKIDGILRIHI